MDAEQADYKMADLDFTSNFIARRSHLPAKYTINSISDGDQNIKPISVKLTKPFEFKNISILPEHYKNTFDISIRLLKGGRTENVTVSKLTTVQQLRTLIKDKFDVSEDSQRLVYQGKALPSIGKSLYDFSISENASITLLVKPPSGELETPKAKPSGVKSAIELPTSPSKSSALKTKDEHINKYYKYGLETPDFFKDVRSVIAKHFGDDEEDLDEVYNSFIKGYNDICGALTPDMRNKLRSVEKL